MTFNLENIALNQGESLRVAVISPQEALPPFNTPVIYVPGLGGSVKQAIPFLTQVACRLGTVYSLDARGLGINEELPYHATPGAYLKDFAVLMQHGFATGWFNAERPPILMGLSLGGVYATLAAAANPRWFSKLVLLAPAFKPHPATFTRRYQIRHTLGMLVKAHRATALLPYTAKELTQSVELHDSPHYADSLTLPTYYLWLIALLGQKAFSNLNRITIPTAVMIPDKDLICDTAVMKKALHCFKNPKSKIFHYPKMYHDVVQEPVEMTDELLSDLSNWLHSTV